MRLRLPWRRRDAEPEGKAVWIIDAASGERIRNVAALQITREFGELVFEAAGAGEYHVYTMPFAVEGRHFPKTVYDRPESTASPDWLAAHAPDPAAIRAKWPALPEAEVIAFEARTDFDRTDPMELIATEDEEERMLAAHPGQPYLLFPEDRRFPIRMTKDLPWRWVRSGPASQFAGQACRNEFYVFQIGVFAARAGLRGISVTFTDVVPEAGGEPIPAGALRCSNTGGHDWLGRRFSKALDVPEGAVQALWIGVDVPGDAEPGAYRGSVTVRPDGQPAAVVGLRLTVLPKTLDDRGGSELWRLSRLRWLDSDAGLEEEVTRPYVPLEVGGAAVTCLGRRVTFAEGGLPESIRAGDTELLARPVSFRVETEAGTLPWNAAEASVTRQTAASVTIESRAEASGLTLRARTVMEFDGYLNVQLTLRADVDFEAGDCRLDVPLRGDAARYMMGMGCKGGCRPDTWEWKWDEAKHQDSLWVGDVDGGVQLKLKGPGYRWPLVNIHYKHRPLLLPEAWHNEGRGGCSVVPEDEGTVVVRAYSGPISLEAGRELRFDFGVLVTPVKPLDLRSHWRHRYYHGGVPGVDEVAAKGGRIINIHHGNHLNPYINYPFLTPDRITEYVRDAHERGLKVKLYYTIRELSNHVAELWALRSLGHEVFADGPGGGIAWLQEHLCDGYSPAWHHPFADGTWCAAISQTGLSRWHNYYVEGLAWLAANLGIDGLYLDEIGYDREIMKRVRRVLDRHRPGSLLDLHSWNHFNGRAGFANCLNLYLEHLPYLDSLWIGEGRDYDEPPDHWLVEVSGIPFGLFSEMLQGGGNPWRGMLYGMTTRLPWSGDPTPIWKLLDEFGVADAEMLGYWDKHCPVRTDCDGVLATVYRRPDRSLVCLASWEKAAVDCRLSIDWRALGLDGGKASLHAPEIGGLQAEDLFKATDPIPIEPGAGWMLVVDEKQRTLPPAPDAYVGRGMAFQEDFPGGALGQEWAVTCSDRAGAAVSVADSCLVVACTANTCAFVERRLPPRTTLVECELNSGDDGGQTWGVGLGLVWPERFLRIHLRTEDKRFGYDDTGKVMFGPSAAPGTWQRVRIRLERTKVLLEVMRGGRRPRWRGVAVLDRARFPGDPVAVRIGKMDAAGRNRDFPQPGRAGTCRVRRLRVYTGEGRRSAGEGGAGVPEGEQ